MRWLWGLICPCHLAGGWLQGGDAGNLKLTLPTAFTTSMLAWGVVAFPSGYKTEASRARVCFTVLHFLMWQM